MSDIEERIREVYNSRPAGAPPRTDPEVISGDDDRLDYHDQRVTVALRRAANATVILTTKDRLVKQDDGSFRLVVQDYLQRRSNTEPLVPACSGERFATQKVGGWCSGFMVGPDIVVTAGHCSETSAQVQRTAFVFGFRAGSNDGEGTTHFAPEQVYFGQELIEQDLSVAGDYAIVRVDRRITWAPALPVEVRASGKAASVGDRVGVIGYPSGLPVKIAFGASTKVKAVQGPWLLCNLDTYGGNSGSPVFAEDGTVEGILVRGAEDFKFKSPPAGDTCFVSNRISDAQGAEAVTDASVFVDKIPR